MSGKLEDVLKGTRRNIREVCEELGIEIPETLGIEQCTHCNVWSGRLKADLDGNPICGFCLVNYGE
jgi:hypothetical protein